MKQKPVNVAVTAAVFLTILGCSEGNKSTDSTKSSDASSGLPQQAIDAAIAYKQSECDPGYQCEGYKFSDVVNEKITSADELNGIVDKYSARVSYAQRSSENYPWQEWSGTVCISKKTDSKWTASGAIMPSECNWN